MKIIRRAAIVAALALAGLALAYVRVDWYPAMGVHALHVVAFHHYTGIGWIEVRPGYSAFRFYSNEI